MLCHKPVTLTGEQAQHFTVTQSQTQTHSKSPPMARLVYLQGTRSFSHSSWLKGFPEFFFCFCCPNTRLSSSFSCSCSLPGQMLIAVVVSGSCSTTCSCSCSWILLVPSILVSVLLSMNCCPGGELS